MLKNEASALQSQVEKDKEALEGEYQRVLEVIFAYGYGCGAFGHNICGSQPVVPNGMPNTSNLLPPEFFIIPWCPPAPTTAEAAVVEADLSETVKEPTNIFYNHIHKKVQIKKNEYNLMTLLHLKYTFIIHSQIIY